jgi:hypothetical protein
MPKMTVNSIARRLAPLVALAASVVFPHSAMAQPQSQPEVTINITEVPPAATGGPDEMFPISGETKGANPRECRVVIYVLAGGTWFVQPYDYSPLTEVRADGKWETETHGGSIYAAILVRPSYKAKAQLKALPDIGGEILARHRIAGKRQ